MNVREAYGRNRLKKILVKRSGLARRVSYLGGVLVVVTIILGFFQTTLRDRLVKSADASVGSTYTLHFPILFAPEPGARFSIGGVDSHERLAQVVPDGLAIDPYIWDALPHLKSSIQVIRTCTYYREKTFRENGGWHLHHLEWHVGYKVGHICFDPLTSQIAKIVSDVNCPYGLNKPCLDISSDAIPNTGEIEFRTLARLNPSWVWMIGNEPDNIYQDALVNQIYTADDATERSIHLGGAEAYANFYKTIYEVIEQEIETTPKLVFCQATFAHDNRPDWGLDYCRKAFVHLQSMGFGPEHIYALSTHQYAHDEETFNGVTYRGGELLDGLTTPYGDGRTVLNLTVGQWEVHLQEFETWAVEAGMGDKPLWLTEYGSLSAWCYEEHVGGGYHAGGVACPDADLGRREYVFYGRNRTEGLWGLQTGQMRYLARTDNQWKAGWWFVSTMGWGTGVCFQTGWLWGGDIDCETASTRTGNLSRAGETHYQVLNCLFYKDCNPPRGSAPQAAAPAVTLAPLPQYCKATEGFLCPDP